MRRCFLLQPLEPGGEPGRVGEQAAAERLVATCPDAVHELAHLRDRWDVGLLLGVTDRATGEEPHRHRSQLAAMMLHESPGVTMPATRVERPADDDCFVGR